uniref:Uncharacterized protein n=1 Tax=Tanacetum cinerariifolium TaxID=118510 RepID=A0A699R3L1_TANCI|nr:hypothetical protein [Tanacetum cinerariifolium]
MMLYEALDKSMNRDHTDELLQDLAEARRKKKKRRDLLKTPPGSPPHQPPPPLPPVEKNEKTTTKTKAESMVSVTIQQDTSAIPPMTTPIIDLTSRPESPNHIDELEHIMANLFQDNKHLEERLDSHGTRLYTLENLDIPQQVSKVVDGVVTDAVDWAIQAPL